MFKRFFKRERIHEPVAVALMFASGFTLTLAWITNLFIVRVPQIGAIYSIAHQLGPISGMYAQSAFFFFFSFGMSLFAWRGRDVSHMRERMAWFLLASVMLFIVMTIPYIYGFEISAGSR